MKTALLDWRLFNATVWQPLRTQVARTSLAVIAIALGVALGLAIFLITRTATEETARASRSLFGQAEYVVQGTAEGFNESIYPNIARIPGVALASPVVEMRVPIFGQRTSLVILGRDYLHAARLQNATATARPNGARSRDALQLLEPNNIQLSESAAKNLGVARGDTLTIQVGMRPVALKIIGIIPSALYPQDVGLMDIAGAQLNLGRLGKLSRIEVRLLRGANTQVLLAKIEQLLPAHIKITTPADEIQQVAQLTRPITINLLGVALVALFTGMFLVYSTQSLTIARRRREFALLHALGLTRREQIASVLYAGGLLGVVGAAMGIGIGVVLAQMGLKIIPGDTTQLHYAWMEIAMFAMLGILTSVVGSIAPAFGAARVPTAQALKAGDVQESSHRGHAYIALTLFALAAPLLWAPPLFELPVFGYTAIAFMLFGAVLLMPLFTRHALRVWPRLRHVGYQIAIAHLRGVAHSATSSVATMLVSISLMVAMSIMGTSLRGSMAAWANQMFPADLVVQAGNGLATLDLATAESVTAIPGINRTERVRSIPLLLSRDRPPITLLARASASLMMEASAHLPMDRGAIPIWVNRALADRDGLAPDDTIRLQLGGHDVVGSVRGVWRDYFNRSGALVIEYDQYRQLTADEGVSSLYVWLAQSGSAEKVARSIRERIEHEVAVDISLPGEIRERMLRGYDTLYGIIYLLLAVSVLIGLFGIGVNASAQVLARRAEFGVLRHLGFTRAEIGGVLCIEGLSLGTLGVIAGLIVGIGVSAVMIYVVTPQSFHWTMDLHVPTSLLLALCVAVPIAASLTALWSGRSAMNDDVIRAVKEDW